MSSITDFLDFIQPDLSPRFVELRAIANHEVFQAWPSGAENVAGIAYAWDTEGIDVYYGVLPRYVYGGAKASDCMSTCTVLWADLDAKHNALGKKGCLDALLTFPVPASVIVDSGHGYHAYWKLDKAYPFPDCQKAMKGIARYLGGDSVYDQARVLRLPGTHNHKDEIPLPVRTIRLDETRIFQLSDFDEWVPSVRIEASWVPRIKPTADDEARRGLYQSLADPYIYDLAQASVPKGTRSEVIFSLILLCFRKGWEAPEIEQLIWTSPIGEKAREKGEDQGRRWIQRSIQKAQRG